MRRNLRVLLKEIRFIRVAREKDFKEAKGVFRLGAHAANLFSLAFSCHFLHQIEK